MSAELKQIGRLAITNARLFDPSCGRDETGSLLIEAGIIKAVGADVQWPDGTQTMDAQGMMLLPGLVDMQINTGEPGSAYRETLATVSDAAAAGGVTSIVTMPDTDPVIDDAALVDFISRRARDTAKVRVFPTAAITKGLDGEMMTEFGLLREAGAVAFTDADRSVMNAQVMSRALAYATNFDALVMHHAQDANLAGAGVMNSGEKATRLGLAGIPKMAEIIMIERDIRLVEMTKARLHIAQISCAESLDIIRAAKQRDLPITCGVSANHLMLNDNDVENYRTFAKLNPPLRSEDDRLALCEGIADGSIDIIVSAHNPQDEDTKRRPFEQASFGSVGVQTLLGAALTLHHEGSAPLDKIIRAVTSTPAQLLGLSAGTLAPGQPADVALIDLDHPWSVTAVDLKSKSKNTAIEGRKLQGRVMQTFVQGQRVFEVDGSA
ncbi:MAG: dihydroorotase [Parvibaculales bacterium]